MKRTSSLTDPALTNKRITIGELAQHLDVAVITVRRWIAAGLAPPHIRLGRTIRFRLQDIENWEAERVQEQTKLASDRQAAMTGLAGRRQTGRNR